MKTLLLAASLVLAAYAADAQSTGTSSVAPGLRNNGVISHASQSRRRDKGQRPAIDHSMDRLVVEPTHSTVTLTVPSPVAMPMPTTLADQSRQ
jgi:hypothetical protein